MKFSIIVPLYNKEESVGSTIQSILDQKYRNFELLIINDGSTDNSLNVVSSFNDERIRIINKENGGVSSARNLGIKEAKYEWIVFFDADDIMYENALSEYVNLSLKFPDILVLVASYDKMIKGKLIKYPSSESNYIIYNYEKAEVFSLLRTKMSVVMTLCICVNKKCFQVVGMFNVNYTNYQDIDMWKRLLMKYDFAKSEKSVAIYRMDAENRSDVKNKNKKFPDFEFPTRKNSNFMYKKIKLGSYYFYQIKSNIISKNSIKYLLSYADLILLFLIVKLLFMTKIITKRA